MNPRYYWYGIVWKMVQKYPYGENPTARELQYMRVINDAIIELSEMPDGEARFKAVHEVLIRKTKTINGAAQEVNYSRRTVQRWLNAFIDRVGHGVGF